MTAAAAPGRALTLPMTSTGRPILARANLDTYDPRPRRSGGRERYFCPIHGGDHQRSLSVDPQTGYYTCHSCGAKGTLREHWPDAGGKQRPARAPSIEEMGRRELEMRARADAERAERLVGEIPGGASSFLGNVDAMVAALREHGNAGAAYLRRRGLDPELAAALGVGYAAPNTWPGDRGRKVGRVVYPLANPATGRVVSALGRLCVDADPAWSEAVRADFARVKQRKLAGCPAGVWPYGSVAAARDGRLPLVLVEGPADALALMQRAPAGSEAINVVALLGTVNVLPAALLRELPGVVMALDEDGSGARAMRELRTELAITGVRVERLPGDWLGGGKDAGELAAGLVAAVGDEVAAAVAARRYDDAVDAVRRACRRFTSAGWDEEAVARLLTDFYARCAAVYDTLAEDRRQSLVGDLNGLDVAIDEACAARNWSALKAVIELDERQHRAPTAVISSR